MNTLAKFINLVIAAALTLLCSQCKKAVPEKDLERGSLQDVQGNTYGTVKIGEDWWTTENLKVKVFNDSTPIKNVPINAMDSLWSALKTPAYCLLDDRYGMLYNYFTITHTIAIAPSGWHVAKEEDWIQLEKSLGMTDIQTQYTGWRGEQQSLALLPDNSTGWVNSDNFVFGTNASGFTALPGGCRVFNGKTNELGSNAYWWAANASNSSEAYYRNINTTTGQIFRYYADKRYGFSLRLVKDR